jgi:hypothetical protein|nr:MAG TPA: hypothetical protein [Caudoviricetes sp.]
MMKIISFFTCIFLHVMLLLLIVTLLLFLSGHGLAKGRHSQRYGVELKYIFIRLLSEQREGKA